MEGLLRKMVYKLNVLYFCDYLALIEYVISARQFSTRSDTNGVKVSILKSSNAVRLNDSPAKLSALHLAAVFLSCTDTIQQQIIMLPRYDLLGKIIQLVAHDIQSSGNTKGLFLPPESVVVSDMEISEESIDASDAANVASNPNVLHYLLLLF